MLKGTVKWFNFTKGYGFIMPDNGGADVFVHINNVNQSGLKGLKEGDKISFDIATNNNKQSAVDIKLVD